MEFRNFEEFAKANEIRIVGASSIRTTPPLYYQSLNDALYNYFKTVQNYKDSYHFLIDFSIWNRESIALNFSNADSAVFTILGLHRYFELLLKDIISRVNPFLSVKFPEKEEDAIKYIYREVEPGSLETIEFRKTFERFKRLIKISQTDFEKPELEIIRKFAFLNDDSLEILAKWRNRIMHNGNTIPNIYLLDYLVSQKYIPLINQVVKIDNEALGTYIPHYFKTLTEIEIIEEINKIKYDFRDFHSKGNAKALQWKILKLAHLKELGRAAYLLERTISVNISYYQTYYKDPIGQHRRFAEQERKHEAFCDLQYCLCCGFETLVIYRDEFYDIFRKENDFISWFNCITCGYSLKNNLGDPYYFGLSWAKIFPEQ